MKRSFSYYLVLLVLKLKGVKKSFSKPIDHLQIRKDDVKSPKGSFYKHNITAKNHIQGTKVTEISTDTHHKLIIYLHGGAFVKGPSQHHWRLDHLW